MKAVLPLLLLIALAPAFYAQENDGEPTPAAVAAKLAGESPAISMWRTTLANALKELEEEDPDFEADEMQEMKDAVNGVLAALDKLYRARLLFGYTCIAEAYEAHAMRDENSIAMWEKWKKIVEECAERDLQAVFLEVLWVEPAHCPHPPAHDMRIIMPRYIRAFMNRCEGGGFESNIRSCDAMENMNAMVEGFSEVVFHIYDGTDEGLDLRKRESLTGFPVEGMENTDTVALFAKLQKLYAEAESCWRDYCGKAEGLVSPCRSFRGSGTCELGNALVCHLLNSRDIYLSHIAAGLAFDPSYEWELQNASD